MSPEKAHILEVEAEAKKTEKTMSLARYVMGRMVRKVNVDEGLLQHWVLPAEDFSGDVVAASMTAGDRVHLMLADGTGHGISAALCMMPVSEIFYAMSGKGFPIASIARELNKKMVSLLPVDRFVAATLASIDWSNKTIEIWNGGGPAAFFVNETGERIQTWKSKNLPIGVLSDKDFDDKVDVFHWEQGGQFFMYSDGLTEARNPDDELFGSERMYQALLRADTASRFEHLKESLMAHIDAAVSDDDVSVLAVNCKTDFEGSVELEAKTKSNQAIVRGPGTWKLELKLDAADIQKIDLLPILLTWLKQCGISQKNSQRLFLILTELYNNAVDHGLLGLDSKLKTSSEGFEGYLKKRSERLSKLQEASIEIYLERIKDKKEDYLFFRIKDSGPGFDFVQHFRGRVICMDSLSGRGITLVNSLTRRMTYLEPGNEVEVEYILSQ